MINPGRGPLTVYDLTFSPTYFCKLSIPQRKQPPKANWFSSNAHQGKYQQHGKIQSTPLPLTHSSLFYFPISYNFCISTSLVSKLGILQYSTAIYRRHKHTDFAWVKKPLSKNSTFLRNFSVLNGYMMYMNTD